ncbi:hypothetical protein OOZ15_18680 [Galbibacter sp. EGI 63066]|nr:hypothetical protein [Galbibacter sp. EGI 63066]MCX2681984.1 hypothetical protein [Galbibacter sp. EGI 63066]
MQHLFGQHSIQNADKGIDSKSLRRAIQRKRMKLNINIVEENTRNRKTAK